MNKEIYWGSSELKKYIIKEVKELARDNNEKDFLFKLCKISAMGYKKAEELKIYE